MKLKTKNLLTLAELSPKEFVGLIDESIKLKKELKKGGNKPLLKNKTLTMIFQKPSTRTRVSFEIGMSQLGGYAVNLSSNDMQLSRGESVEDTAKTLSRYTDCIMARVYDHDLLEKLSQHATIPVINGLSDAFHPCQILADFMTIKEKKKKLQGIKIAWVGDGNNVCNSMIYGAALSGASMSIATPKGFEPDKKTVKEAQKSTKIKLTTDPIAAAKNADVVVTDTYSSIHNDDPKRIKKFLPKYQVNPKLMKSANKDAIFMHCLPAKRDQEVTSSVIDGPQSVIWDEAENRLHTQKALLASLIRA
ncbi:MULTISPECIES: ornithine carbamoyltransferase [Nitrosopumilus]|uniref:Ornithine carbamoyltransferase n=1 Tax=Nitrosopumilus piranensis TaxID=1582439 RepID=A0A0C5BXZ5_9ARCH|nr:MULTISPECIES: ornithine carbamoyltransferase [Nitrosopumilus]AJM93179.1 Ornithine carbamoyltransferase [Nitrosopumilus piranensis]KAF6245018.1 ornithine carbamoyltransferase [Nitrosopumilus sp. b2]